MNLPARMSERSKPRVLIVGADGADFQIVTRLMSEGKLPCLAHLCAQGMWGALQTTFPPVSPVAWMTCLTGLSPAEHGIRDFITKADGSYLPAVGLFHVSSQRNRTPVYASRCTAPTLAEHLKEAGKTAYLLKVPGTFPPPPVNGGILAGFGMPDLVGSFGVSAWYTTDEAGKKASAPDGKEQVSLLDPVGRGVWYGHIVGPGDTAQGFLFYRRGNQGVIVLEADGKQPGIALTVGGWSAWLRLRFDVPGQGAVDGLCRFKLVSLDSTVELYRTPVQCVPDAPLFPLAEPPAFGAQLQEWVGPFATIGMPADLDGVRRGVVDLDTFLEDAYANWQQQVEMTLCLLDNLSWDLMVTHLFTVDNIQHLFWHCQDARHPAHGPQLAACYGDQIERAYCWLDGQIGQMLTRLDEKVTVIVVSDHGGLPIYRLVYLNAWLRQQGYLVPREPDVEGQAVRVDWERTQAAMFGTGGIWLNVQGRDPRGIVSPGAPFEALRQKVAQALLDWRDPEQGCPVVKAVLRGEEVLGADARQKGPDLVLALHPGYGLGRGEGLGRVMSGKSLVVPNLGAWTGGHEGPYLPSDVPGIGILSGPGVPAGAKLDHASLVDIAPTVLHQLGITGVRAMAGKSLTLPREAGEGAE